MNLDPKTPLDIWIGGSLPGFSGLGASAASSVAIARAISEELNLGLSNDQINAIAYEGEKAYAGNPSGIDNTAATYGGLMWFKKNPAGGQDLVEKIHVRKPIEIVIGSTGKTANTKAMVEGAGAEESPQPRPFQQAPNMLFAGRKPEAVDSTNVGTHAGNPTPQEIGYQQRIDQLVETHANRGFGEL
jgi:mevalonate kinase